MLRVIFGSVKKLLLIVLNIFLALFVASAAFSVVDDSLELVCDSSYLTLISGILSFVAFVAAVLVYVLMAFTRSIPKRIFLPLALYFPASILASLLFEIYAGHHWVRHVLELDLAASIFQLLIGWIVLRILSGGWKIRWPFIKEKHLGPAGFSWPNLAAFAAANVFVLFPAALAWLGLCTVLAVSHLTGGFLTLHPGGLLAHVRYYARNDGKKVELVPMAHIGDAAFYKKLSDSFPTNAVVLMEGVTDEQHLLKYGISYKRMAKSLGLAEQRVDFRPRGELVMADIDVAQFSTNTIQLLNLVMRAHAQGLNPATIAALADYSPPPDFQTELFDDLINKRNHHLLKEFNAWLPDSNFLIIPWGAGHMPEIARAIQNDGFKLAATKSYTIVRFHF